MKEQCKMLKYCERSDIIKASCSPCKDMMTEKELRHNENLHGIKGKTIGLTGFYKKAYWENGIKRPRISMKETTIYEKKKS